MCSAPLHQHAARLRLGAVAQYKERIDVDLIKPAVDWRKTPVSSGTMQAAVAGKQ